MVANILPQTPYPYPSPTFGDGVSRSNFIFSEPGHVVWYQIIENHKCGKIVAKILATDPLHPTLGMGSIGLKINFSEYFNCGCSFKFVSSIMPFSQFVTEYDWITYNCLHSSFSFLQEAI